MEQNLIATNKMARHRYEILETLEAGIELKGSEVKSLRSHHADLRDSYARIDKGEIHLHELYISPYEKSTYDAPDPRRSRRLLIHKAQINKLVGKVQQRGYTIIALQLYFNARGKAKVELAIARGRKLYDQREKIREKESQMQLRKAKSFRR